MRRVAALVLAGVTLAGCGSISPTDATRQWVTKTGFTAAFRNLHDDLDRTVTYLRRGERDTRELRTLCRIVSLDLHKLNDTLPSPDAQANDLLANGLDRLSRGTARCSGATGASSPAPLLRDFRSAYGGIYFGALRLWSAAGLPDQSR
jgi:hypothetical protein